VVERVVLDTNVLVSGLRSRRGASFALLAQLERGDFEAAISVPLVLEYEDALLRKVVGALSAQDIRDFVDSVCAIAHRQRIFFLWRPLLTDPKDDMVAELAVAAQCFALVTHNVVDFGPLDQFGIEVLTPGAYLRRLRGVK
jgi:putative PIN family toxin of toxin-antitoxin system